MLLGFSTLSCPSWPLDKILEMAAQCQYRYLELHYLHLLEKNGSPKNAFTATNLPATRRKIADAGITALSLGSPLCLHEDVTGKVEKLWAGLKQFLDLGAALGAAYIRVFPDCIPEGRTLAGTTEVIAQNLHRFANIVRKHQVKIGVETHGDFTSGKDLAAILARVNDPWVGAVWDAHHTFRKAGESFAETYGHLAKYIFQVHLKDSVTAETGVKYRKLGEGNLPFAQLLQVLAENKYAGPLAAEYEKAWHPEDLGEPLELIGDFKEYVGSKIEHREQ